MGKLILIEVYVPHGVFDGVCPRCGGFAVHHISARTDIDEAWYCKTCNAEISVEWGQEGYEG